ncbi:MAG: DNA primase [Candidatus Electryoneaceae bacterium]|nr:DNA primase [Candidatus Electryoneaceae bacterium]
MAAFFDNTFIERVRESTDLVGLISGYVTLKQRSPGSFWGQCPFHTEKTASFQVRPDRGMFHCFGCGKGGNAYSFLMEIEGISFPEAVKSLAERAGIQLPQQTQTPATQRAGSERDKIYQANQIAQKWFHQQLTAPDPSPQASQALKYLIERGITREIIQRYGLGWSQPGWDGLIKRSAQSGLAGAIVFQAGLAHKRKDGSGYVDRFRARVMFPIFNLSGKPIAFGGRRIDGITPDQDEAKYVNTNETAIYRKGDNLYGLFTSRTEIRKQQFAYLVEGYTDLLALVQADVPNVVASLGTALTQQQATLIRRFAPRIHILYDSDTAGINAAVRASNILIQNGLEVRIVKLPPGDDPDTLLRRVGTDSFQSLLQDQTLSFIRFQLDTANLTASTAHTERLKVARTILDTIRLIPDEMQKDLLIEELSEYIGISKEAIVRTLPSSSKPLPQSTINEETKIFMQVPLEDIAERELLEALLNHPELIPTVVTDISVDDIEHPPLRKIYHILEQAFFRGKALNFADLPNQFNDPILRAFIAQAMLSDDDISLEQDKMKVHDTVIALQTRSLLRRKEEIEELFIKGQPTKELMDEVVELNKQMWELENALSV